MWQREETVLSCFWFTPQMAATSKTELILSHELSWVYYVDAGAQGLELSSSTTFPGCKQGALVEVEQPGIEKIAHMGCQHFRRRISILCHHIVPYNFLSFCFLKVHLYTWKASNRDKNGKRERGRHWLSGCSGQIWASMKPGTTCGLQTGAVLCCLPRYSQELDGKWSSWDPNRLLSGIPVLHTGALLPWHIPA